MGKDGKQGREGRQGRGGKCTSGECKEKGREEEGDWVGSTKNVE